MDGNGKGSRPLVDNSGQPHLVRKFYGCMDRKMNVRASVVDEGRQRINGDNGFPQGGRLLCLMRNRRNGFAAFSGVCALNPSHHGADMFRKIMIPIGILRIKPYDDIGSCPVRQDGGNGSFDFQIDCRV